MFNYRIVITCITIPTLSTCIHTISSLTLKRQKVVGFVPRRIQTHDLSVRRPKLHVVDCRHSFSQGSTLLVWDIRFFLPQSHTSPTTKRLGSCGTGWEQNWEEDEGTTSISSLSEKILVAYSLWGQFFFCGSHEKKTASLSSKRCRDKTEANFFKNFM